MSKAVAILTSLISAEIKQGDQYKLSQNQYPIVDFTQGIVMEFQVPKNDHAVIEEVVVDVVIDTTTNSIDDFVVTSYLSVFRLAIESSKGSSLISFWKVVSISDKGNGTFLVQLSSDMVTYCRGLVKITPAAISNPNYTVTPVGGYVQTLDLQITPNAQ